MTVVGNGKTPIFFPSLFCHKRLPLLYPSTRNLVLSVPTPHRHCFRLPLRHLPFPSTNKLKRELNVRNGDWARSCNITGWSKGQERDAAQEAQHCSLPCSLQRQVLRWCPRFWRIHQAWSASFFPNMFLLIFLKINLMLNLFGQSMSFGFFDTWIFRFCLLLYIIFEEISCFFFPLKMSLSSYYGDLVIFVGFSLASVFDFWALVLYIGKCWSYFDFILTCDNTHDWKTVCFEREKLKLRGYNEVGNILFIYFYSQKIQNFLFLDV